MSTKKITFEIEADIPDGAKISGVDLKIMREGSMGEWESGLLAIFGRNQTVRDGKHLVINENETTVKVVGT